MSARVDWGRCAHLLWAARVVVRALQRRLLLDRQLIVVPRTLCGTAPVGGVRTQPSEERRPSRGCVQDYVLTVERKPATAPRHVAGVVLVEHGAALVLPHPGQGAVRARLAEDLATPHVSRVSEATKDAQKSR